MRIAIILLALGLTGCATGGAAPLTEKVVEQDGETYRIAYREEFPVWRLRFEGVSTPMRGGQIDTVRALAAAHLDPELCPSGQGFSFDPAKRVTPLLVPQIDYFPEERMFQAFSSCA